jgi:UrcA family protein
MKTFIIIATALTLSGLSVPAAASTDEQKVSVTIQSRDLDLSSDQGVKTLKLRIHRAATEVCGDAAGSDYLEQRKAFRKCYDTISQSAFASAQSKMSGTLAVR